MSNAVVSRFRLNGLRRIEMGRALRSGALVVLRRLGPGIHRRRCRPPEASGVSSRRDRR